MASIVQAREEPGVTASDVGEVLGAGEAERFQDGGGRVMRRTRARPGAAEASTSVGTPVEPSEVAIGFVTVSTVTGRYSR
ncbi:hypothetical protein [Nocardia cyriacigeorgica]|uniref:hypothetical protein n=1 Tax=Nocardia cyriacigeorgica TaxID=135487 RepID=UPI0015B5E5F7